MSECCTPIGEGRATCPRCGVAGLVVGAEPVRAHRPTAADGSWRYCPNAGCEAVFFLGDDVVDDHEVVCQVGAKALAKPIPVCFCFAHTVEEIRADVAGHDGSSTIKKAVKAAVAGGLCACEHLNPSRDCCLPAVHRAVSAARQRLGERVAGG